MLVARAKFLVGHDQRGGREHGRVRPHHYAHDEGKSEVRKRLSSEEVKGEQDEQGAHAAVDRSRHGLQAGVVGDLRQRRRRAQVPVFDQAPSGELDPEVEPLRQQAYEGEDHGREGQSEPQARVLRLEHDLRSAAQVETQSYRLCTDERCGPCKHQQCPERAPYRFALHDETRTSGSGFGDVTSNFGPGRKPGLRRPWRNPAGSSPGHR